MGNLIIGNLCSLLAMITDSVSSTRKTAKGVLLMQALSQSIFCVSALLLKGYSAAVQNIISVIRNIAATKENLHKAVEWVLIVLGVGLGIYFNNRGLAGWLPIIANLEYALVILWFKNNERVLKISFAVSVLMYSVFNLFIYNFVGVVTNLVVFVMTVGVLIKEAKAKA